MLSGWRAGRIGGSLKCRRGAAEPNCRCSRCCRRTCRRACSRCRRCCTTGSSLDSFSRLTTGCCPGCQPSGNSPWHSCCLQSTCSHLNSHFSNPLLDRFYFLSCAQCASSLPSKCRQSDLGRKLPTHQFCLSLPSGGDSP